MTASNAPARAGSSPSGTVRRAAPSGQVDPRSAALHLANRLGFGPTPGDPERILAEGLEAFIARQIAGNAADGNVEARVGSLPGVFQTTTEIVRLHQGSNFSRVPIEKALEDLRCAKLIRAVHSENQLREVMVDFWYNHFNVYAYAWEPSTPAYEREAIRPHALGNFRALLGATAFHPAMLFYLDSYLSTAPRVINGREIPGLNENYGRELLELHTVGVGTGYTQNDVVDAARAFTGCGIEGLVSGEPDTFAFRFQLECHDRGEKEVFGCRLAPGGGLDDAQTLLDYLASHPFTARFVSHRLAERFVADDPPDALVQRCAHVFLSTGGDIRSVLETIFCSPEFWAPEVIRGKVKTPFEFAASCVRALGLELSDARPLAVALEKMGMPLYGCRPPTGYSNRGSDWLNGASQMARFDLAFRLGAGIFPGVAQDGITEDRSRPLRATLSSRTRRALSSAGGQTARERDQRIAGLALASPEFQMR